MTDNTTVNESCQKEYLNTDKTSLSVELSRQRKIA